MNLRDPLIERAYGLLIALARGDVLLVRQCIDAELRTCGIVHMRHVVDRVKRASANTGAPE